MTTSIGYPLIDALATALHADAQLAAFMGKARYVFNQRVPPSADGRWITITGYGEDEGRSTYGRHRDAGVVNLGLWTPVHHNMDALEMYAHVKRVLSAPLTLATGEVTRVRLRLTGTIPDDAGGTQGVVEMTVDGHGG